MYAYYGTNGDRKMHGSPGHGVEALFRGVHLGAWIPCGLDDIKIDYKVRAAVSFLI